MPKEEEKPTKISFPLRLPREVKQNVKKKAKELGMSENAIISLAVNNYIKTL